MYTGAESEDYHGVIEAREDWRLVVNPSGRGVCMQRRTPEGEYGPEAFGNTPEALSRKLPRGCPWRPVELRQNAEWETVAAQVREIEAERAEIIRLTDWGRSDYRWVVAYGPAWETYAHSGIPMGKRPLVRVAVTPDRHLLGQAYAPEAFRWFTCVQRPSVAAFKAAMMDRAVEVGFDMYVSPEERRECAARWLEDCGNSRLVQSVPSDDDLPKRLASLGEMPTRPKSKRRLRAEARRARAPAKPKRTAAKRSEARPAPRKRVLTPGKLRGGR